MSDKDKPWAAPGLDVSERTRSIDENLCRGPEGGPSGGDALIAGIQSALDAAERDAYKRGSADALRWRPASDKPDESGRFLIVARYPPMFGIFDRVEVVEYDNDAGKWLTDCLVMSWIGPLLDLPQLDRA